MALTAWATHVIGFVVRNPEVKSPPLTKCSIAVQANGIKTTLQAARRVTTPTILMANAETPITNIQKAWITCDRDIQLIASDHNPNQVGVFWMGAKAITKESASD